MAILAIPAIVMVTDRQRLAGSLDRVAGAIARAARAGVDLVQIREPDLDDRALAAFVTRAATSIRGTRARVVVNGRADIGLAAGAAGVHLPGSGVPAPRVCAIVPQGFLVGRSVHSRAEAQAAESAGGCDYLIFGTVFPSNSKPPGHPAAGLDVLRDVCQAVRLPVIAIGGINAARAADVAHAGAKGAAGIELFANADEGALAAAVERMRRAFE